jgi:hypothetical protein
MSHAAHHQATNDELQQCIKECLDCHASCLETSVHCLALGGKHAELDHIRMLEDCAEICQTSANFMLRGSGYHSRTCAVCAEVCRACEERCRRMGGDDMMRRCAEACRRCAESCERMAAAVA